LPLDIFAISYLKELGFKKAKLSVSPKNLRAINFYTKNGWRDIGLRSEVDRTGKGLKFPLNYMEKEL
jgi:ribosomal protein S18 acetylase RimI-like enzyme